MNDLEHKSRFLSHLRAGTHPREVKALAGDITSGGAYALPKLLASAIGRAPAPAHAIPGLVARATSRGADFSEPVENGQPAWHWQGDVPGDETPLIRAVQPPVGEIVVEFEITRHLMQDADFDMEAFFVARAATAFAEAEAIAFLAGSGVKRPAGLVGAVAINTAPDADFGVALRALRDATPAQYRQHWLMPAVLADRLDGLAAFAAADNHGPARLHGIPVLIEEACQKPGTGLVLLGSLGDAYRATDILPGDAASPVEVMLDPFSKTGFLRVIITKRVGGTVRNAAAISGFEVALS